jgi:hypothetical protein
VICLQELNADNLFHLRELTIEIERSFQALPLLFGAASRADRRIAKAKPVSSPTSSLRLLICMQDFPQIIIAL